MENKIKIEDQIEILVKFVKKYPDITISPIISESNLRKFHADNRKINKLINDYQLALKCYSYLRDRKSQGKLTKEQIQKCINANIGGVFGYSKKIKELSSQYEVSERLMAYLIGKYGSIDKLYEQYKNNAIDQTDEVIIFELIKPVYDIDLDEDNINYNKLMKDISYIDKLDTYIYSSKLFNEALKTLKENEKQIIRLRYGIDNCKIKTFNEISEMFNLSEQRIRQILSKTLKRLRSLSIEYKYLYELDELIEKGNLSDEEKEEILKADEICRLSRTKNDKTITAKNTIRNLFYKNNKLQKESKNANDIRIDELRMHISSRLYNSLKRSNINTIGDIISHNYNWLLDIRNLGKNCRDELIKILEDYGYKINEQGYFVNKDGKRENIITDINKILIKDLPMSKKLRTILTERDNIYTLSDILSHNYYYYEKLKYMKETELKELVILLKDNGYIVNSNGVFVKEGTKEQENEEEYIDIKEVNLDEIPMSKRLYTCLRRSNINTIGDILSHNYDYLSKITNMGRIALNELVLLLEKYNYVLDTNGNFILKDELNKQENTTDNKQELTLEQIKKQNEEMKKRINEKEEKSKLLDEYINLMKEQEKLKEMESSLDEQIKKKEEQLKAKGYKYENKE